MLLCDEPTGALDSRTGVFVLEVLVRANRELGTATAVIINNTSIAALGDRVITFADGLVRSERRNARRLAPAEVSW